MLESQPGIRQANAQPSGTRTGAPPRTVFKSLQVAPGSVPTIVVDEGRENRVVTILAPNVPFSIYIGGEGVNVSSMPLVAGLQVEVVLPGYQALFAVSDAPVFLQIGVQIAGIPLGDTERK